MPARPPRTPFPSRLTFGPKWPYHRTNTDTGNRYHFDQASRIWIFSCGPEGEGL